MVEKACKKCRTIVNGEVCPACGGTDLTKNWEGYILLFNPSEDIGKALNAKVPGKYALKIK
ncbi:DNA-directed RNA polymerase, subunit E'' [Candidatus Micrarchaeota archaeon]|nr:DNA-directed RNA polymerase, subunit E'' [Candidatus Micrarchaeota archaeon]